MAKLVEAERLDLRAPASLAHWSDLKIRIPYGAIGPREYQLIGPTTSTEALKERQAFIGCQRNREGPFAAVAFPCAQRDGAAVEVAHLQLCQRAISSARQ